MRLALRLIAPLALCATPGIAQTPDAEAGETICISIGQPWMGDGADARAIESVPVPESYRRQFESTVPCVRYWLVEDSLIDWHLNFGSIRSITPALIYLERDYLREVPASDRYQAALESAWRGAQADLRRARNIRQPEGLNYSVPHRFIDSSRPIRRLRSLVEARENFVFLAQQYLRAAEEFASLPLLETAERHIRVAVTAGEFLAPLEREPPVAGLLHFNLHIFVTDDLEMRAAVLRARLTRDAADIARAEAVISARENPIYERLAEIAVGDDDDLCEIGPGWGDAENLEAICRGQNDLPERIINVLASRALLNLVQDGPSGERPIILDLLHEGSRNQQRRCCGQVSMNDLLLRLRLALAERLTRSDDMNFDAILDLHEALRVLRETERLVPPHDAPARFRRVAETWLSLYRRGDSMIASVDAELRPSSDSQSARYAAHLNALLERLDMIATDTTPPAPNP